MKLPGLLPAVVLLAATAAAVPAQGTATQPPRVTIEASGRATTVLNVRGAGGNGAQIAIEYGQPHARGREVFGTLVPFDSVWRAGANRATHLTTDVPITIGTTRLAAGTYTLFLRPSRGVTQLIVNSRTRQWGIPYNTQGEIARIPMQSRTLRDPIETFTIALVPSTTAQGTGALTMAWGTMLFSVDFSAQP